MRGARDRLAVVIVEAQHRLGAQACWCRCPIVVGDQRVMPALELFAERHTAAAGVIQIEALVASIRLCLVHASSVRDEVRLYVSA